MNGQRAYFAVDQRDLLATEAEVNVAHISREASLLTFGRRRDTTRLELKFRLYGQSNDVQHVTSPLAVLNNHAGLARLFNHYIKTLANWYDLSDADASFEKRVPAESLSRPLLFNAIIAFSAMHLSKTTSPHLLSEAENHHEKCIKLLIQLKQQDIEAEDGVTLAAVCLLRSYEILGEEFDPNRHLSGAFALAINRLHSLREISLARAGFFNFMREDITFSLSNRCPLKLNMDNIAVPDPRNDEDQLNIATLYLAKTINHVFETGNTPHATPAYSDDYERWRSLLPARFTPYFESPVSQNEGAFPTIRMLRDCHVSVLQYCLVLQSVLRSTDPTGGEHEALLHQHAVRLCGLAFTSDSPAVTVNSFGPISFSCRYLRAKPLQMELARRLHECQKDTGWPVQRIIDDLKQCWSENER